MRTSITLFAALLLALAAGGTSPACGAWTSVEDFEDGAWSNYTLRGATLSVETEASNKVGKWTVTGNNQGVDVDIPNIVDGTTGTLFYRVKWGRGPNMNKALINNAQGWVTRSTWESGRYDRIQDSAAWQVIATPGFTTGQIADNTWYSYWMVVNHTADTWNLYGQKDGSDSPTLLSYGSNDSTFTLNSTSAAEYLRLMNTGGSLALPTYEAWVDDVYVDLSGANLGNPIPAAQVDETIPEPATMALLAFGLTSVGGYLRRRRGA